METIELNIIKMTQPIGEIYVSTINAYKLFSMSKSDIIKLSAKTKSYDGIQREIKKEKVTYIKDYLTSIDATMPNSIVLNLDSQYIVNRSDSKITVKLDENTFSIIDGQHRLKGFEDSKDTKFDLSISFFIDLPKDLQSRVFVTINSEQTKVDPSISFYQEHKENNFTPRKMVADLSIMFAKDVSSPWRKKIKLIGKKDELSEEGMISLNTFAQKILTFIYNDKKFFNKLRNQVIKHDNKLNLLKGSFGESFLWDFYKTYDELSLYKILSNFFNAMKEIFKKDWEDKNSILTKTTGYNAMMKLFKDLFKRGLEKGTLDKNFFKDELIKLSKLDETINSKNYGASGAKASNDLYDAFKKIINE